MIAVIILKTNRHHQHLFSQYFFVAFFDLVCFFSQMKQTEVGASKNEKI